MKTTKQKNKNRCAVIGTNSTSEKQEIIQHKIQRTYKSHQPYRKIKLRGTHNQNRIHSQTYKLIYKSILLNIMFLHRWEDFS